MQLLPFIKKYWWWITGPATFIFGVFFAGMNLVSWLDNRLLEFERRLSDQIANFRFESYKRDTDTKGEFMTKMLNFSERLTRVEERLKISEGGKKLTAELKREVFLVESEKNSIPSGWPTEGRITTSFGPYPSPFTGKMEFHTGIDIVSPRGTPVYAPGDATVKFTGVKGQYGNVIILDHGIGIRTEYQHLSEISVKKGEKLKKGQLIGKVGNTGKSTAPHLHYEIRVNDKPTDPVKVLPEKTPPVS